MVLLSALSLFSKCMVMRNGSRVQHIYYGPSVDNKVLSPLPSSQFGYFSNQPWLRPSHTFRLPFHDSCSYIDHAHPLRRPTPWCLPRRTRGFTAKRPGDTNQGAPAAQSIDTNNVAAFRVASLRIVRTCLYSLLGFPDTLYSPPKSFFNPDFTLALDALLCRACCCPLTGSTTAQKSPYMMCTSRGEVVVNVMKLETGEVGWEREYGGPKVAA